MAQDISLGSVTLEIGEAQSKLEELSSSISKVGSSIDNAQVQQNIQSMVNSIRGGQGNLSKDITALVGQISTAFKDVDGSKMMKGIDELNRNVSSIANTIGSTFGDAMKQVKTESEAIDFANIISQLRTLSNAFSLSAEDAKKQQREQAKTGEYNGDAFGLKGLSDSIIKVNEDITTQKNNLASLAKEEVSGNVNTQNQTIKYLGDNFTTAQNALSDLPDRLNGFSDAIKDLFKNTEENGVKINGEEKVTSYVNLMKKAANALSRISFVKPIKLEEFKTSFNDVAEYVDQYTKELESSAKIAQSSFKLLIQPEDVDNIKKTIYGLRGTTEEQGEGKKWVSLSNIFDSLKPLANQSDAISKTTSAISDLQTAFEKVNFSKALSEISDGITSISQLTAAIKESVYVPQQAAQQVQAAAEQTAQAESNAAEVVVQAEQKKSRARRESKSTSVEATSAAADKEAADAQKGAEVVAQAEEKKTRARKKSQAAKDVAKDTTSTEAAAEAQAAEVIVQAEEKKTRARKKSQDAKTEAATSKTSDQNEAAQAVQSAETIVQAEEKKAAARKKSSQESLTFEEKTLSTMATSISGINKKLQAISTDGIKISGISEIAKQIAEAFIEANKYAGLFVQTINGQAVNTNLSSLSTTLSTPFKSLTQNMSDASNNIDSIMQNTADMLSTGLTVNGGNTSVIKLGAIDTTGVESQVTGLKSTFGDIGVAIDELKAKIGSLNDVQLQGFTDKLSSFITSVSKIKDTSDTVVNSLNSINTVIYDGASQKITTFIEAQDSAGKKAIEVKGQVENINSVDLSTFQAKLSGIRPSEGNKTTEETIAKDAKEIVSNLISSLESTKTTIAERIKEINNAFDFSPAKLSMTNFANEVRSNLDGIASLFGSSSVSQKIIDYNNLFNFTGAVGNIESVTDAINRLNGAIASGLAAITSYARSASAISSSRAAAGAGAAGAAGAGGGGGTGSAGSAGSGERQRANALYSEWSEYITRIDKLSKQIQQVPNHGLGSFQLVQDYADQIAALKENLKEVMDEIADLDKTARNEDKEAQLRRKEHYIGMDALTAIDSAKLKLNLAEANNYVKEQYAQYDLYLKQYQDLMTKLSNTEVGTKAYNEINSQMGSLIDKMAETEKAIKSVDTKYRDLNKEATLFSGISTRDSNAYNKGAITEAEAQDQAEIDRVNKLYEQWEKIQRARYDTMYELSKATAGSDYEAKLQTKLTSLNSEMKTVKDTLSGIITAYRDLDREAYLNSGIEHDQRKRNADRADAQGVKDEINSVKDKYSQIKTQQTDISKMITQLKSTERDTPFFNSLVNNIEEADRKMRELWAEISKVDKALRDETKEDNLLREEERLKTARELAGLKTSQHNSEKEATAQQKAALKELEGIYKEINRLRVEQHAGLLTPDEETGIQTAIDAKIAEGRKYEQFLENIKQDEAYFNKDFDLIQQIYAKMQVINELREKALASYTMTGSDDDQTRIKELTEQYNNLKDFLASLPKEGVTDSSYYDKAKEALLGVNDASLNTQVADTVANIKTLVDAYKEQEKLSQKRATSGSLTAAEEAQVTALKARIEATYRLNEALRENKTVQEAAKRSQIVETWSRDGITVGNVEQKVKDLTKAYNDLNAAKKRGDRTGQAAAMTDISAIEDAIKITENYLGTLDKSSAEYKALAIAVNRVKLEIKDLNHEQKSSAAASIDRIAMMIKSYVQMRGLRTMWRNAVTYVKEYADALNEIRIVTGKSEEEAAVLGTGYRSLAKEMSTTSKELATSAVDLYRQGLSDDQVIDRLKYITMYSKTSGLDMSSATELMTATINSYSQYTRQVEEAGKVTTKVGYDSQEVASMFTAVGNAAASSGSEIGTAAQKVASVASEAGLSLEYLTAYIATLSEKTRLAPETIGTALNSIIARMRQIKKNGYNEEDETKINDVSKALKTVGVSLMDANGEWRNLNEIFSDIGNKWDDMSDKQRSYIATTMAGTRQQNYFIALMNDLAKASEGNSRAVELYNIAMKSSGSVLTAYSTYMESATAAQDRFKQGMENVYATLLKSSTITGFYDLASNLANGFANATEAASGLNVILPSIMAAIAGFIVLIAKQKTVMSGGSLISLFMGARGGTQVTLIITALLTVIALVTALVAASESANATVTESLEKVNTSINNVKVAQQKAKEAQEEFTNKNDQIRALRDEYIELATKANLTAEDQKRLEEILSQQQDLAPGVATAIDGIADKYERLRGVVNAANEQMKENIRLGKQAAQSEARKGFSELVTASGNLQSAKNKGGVKENAVKSILSWLDDNNELYEWSQQKTASAEKSERTNLLKKDLGIKGNEITNIRYKNDSNGNLIFYSRDNENEIISAEDVVKAFVNSPAGSMAFGGTKYTRGLYQPEWATSNPKQAMLEDYPAYLTQYSEDQAAIKIAEQNLIDQVVNTLDIFASDDELPDLMKKSLHGKLEKMGTALVENGFTEQDLTDETNKVLALADTYNKVYKDNKEQIDKVEDAYAKYKADPTMANKNAYNEAVRTLNTNMQDYVEKGEKLYSEISEEQARAEIAAAEEAKRAAEEESKSSGKKTESAENMVKKVKEAKRAWSTGFRSQYEDLMTVLETPEYRVADENGKTIGYNAVDAFVKYLISIRDSNKILYDHMIESIPGLKDIYNADYEQQYKQMQNWKAQMEDKNSDLYKAYNELFGTKSDTEIKIPESQENAWENLAEAYTEGQAEAVYNLLSQWESAPWYNDLMTRQSELGFSSGEGAGDQAGTSWDTVFSEEDKGSAESIIKWWNEIATAASDSSSTTKKATDDIIADVETLKSTMSAATGDEAKKAWEAIGDDTKKSQVNLLGLDDDFFGEYTEDKFKQLGKAIDNYLIKQYEETEDKTKKVAKGTADLLSSYDTDTWGEKAEDMRKDIGDLYKAMGDYKAIQDGTLKEGSEGWDNAIANLKKYTGFSEDYIKTAGGWEEVQQKLFRDAQMYGNTLKLIDDALPTEYLDENFDGTWQDKLSEIANSTDESVDKMTKALANLMLSIIEISQVGDESSLSGVQDLLDQLGLYNEYSFSDSYKADGLFGTLSTVTSDPQKLDQYAEKITNLMQTEEGFFEASESWKKLPDSVRKSLKKTMYYTDEMDDALKNGTKDWGKYADEAKKAQGKVKAKNLEDTGKAAKGTGDAFSSLVDETDKWNSTASSWLTTIKKLQAGIAGADAIAKGAKKGTTEYTNAIAAIAAATSYTAEQLADQGVYSLALQELNGKVADCTSTTESLLNSLYAVAGSSFDPSSWGTSLLTLQGDAATTYSSMVALINAMLSMEGASIKFVANADGTGGSIDVTGGFKGDSSLLSNSTSSGGGGGGGGNKNNTTKKKTDVKSTKQTRWLSKKKFKIDQIQDQIDRLEIVRGDFEEQGYQTGTIHTVEEINKQLDLQNAQYKKNQAAVEKKIKSTKKELAGLKKGTEAYDQCAKRLSELQKSYAETDKAILENNATMNQNKNTIKELREEILGMEVDLRETILKAIQDRKQKEQDAIDAYIDMQGSIVDAITERYEKEQEQIERTTSLKIEALQKESDAQSESLEKRKEQSEEQNKAVELAKLQAQYARIIADPTRAKEALSIQKKIKDIQEDIAWDQAEKAVESQQKAIEKQVEDLEDYQEKMDEYYEKLIEDRGNMEEEANKVLGMSTDEIIDWQKKNDKDYANSTTEEQEQMIKEWKETINTMKGISVNSWAEVEEIISKGGDYVQEFLKTYTQEYQDASAYGQQQFGIQYADMWTNLVKAKQELYPDLKKHEFTDTTETWIKGVTDKGSSSSSSSGGGTTKPGNNNPANNTTDNSTSTDDGKKIYYVVSNGKAVGPDTYKNAVKYANSHGGVITTDPNKYKTSNLNIKQAPDSIYGNGNSLTKNQSFDTGGVASNDGIAYVHKKERVLTAYQTSLFEGVLDQMDQMSRIRVSMPSVNPQIGAVSASSVTFEGGIVINVEKLADNEDFEEVAERVMEVIDDKVSRGLSVGGVRMY